MNQGDNFRLLLVNKYKDLENKFKKMDSYFLYGSKYFILNTTKEMAIGSGEIPALAAMKAGADSRRAVQIAAELDLYTGGEIHTRFLIDQMR